VIHYGLPGGIQTAGEHWANYGAIYGCPDAPDTRWGEALAAGDFNGDGWDDLAVGIPYREEFDGTGWVPEGGAILVLYGHFGGLFPWVRVRITQNSDGVRDTPHAFDHFGSALAVGYQPRFRDDLAVGVPGEGMTALRLPRQATGLSLPDKRSGRRSRRRSSANDRFGAALTWRLQRRRLR
jgi:hypothetical protein